VATQRGPPRADLPTSPDLDTHMCRAPVIVTNRVAVLSPSTVTHLRKVSKPHETQEHFHRDRVLDQSRPAAWEFGQPIESRSRETEQHPVPVLQDDLRGPALLLPELLLLPVELQNRRALRATSPLETGGPTGVALRDGPGFRMWWRRWQGSDERLNNARLMRVAGRFARRVRGWAKGAGVPVVRNKGRERNEDLAWDHVPDAPDFEGVFAVIVRRAPGNVWDVEQTADGRSN